MRMKIVVYHRGDKHAFVVDPSIWEVAVCSVGFVVEGDLCYYYCYNYCRCSLLYCFAGGCSGLVFGRVVSSRYLALSCCLSPLVHLRLVPRCKSVLESFAAESISLCSCCYKNARNMSVIQIQIRVKVPAVVAKECIRWADRAQWGSRLRSACKQLAAYLSGLRLLEATSCGDGCAGIE